ncbi:hypothetical protein FACS1894186_1250 [Alphaproteobacteria bacterium]|nr:hypothetical protein FACS1894186_1250 [Alphaproteobacteria bacterium]
MLDILPVGTLLPYTAPSLPEGFLYADGAPFDPAEYPELAEIWLKDPDHGLYLYGQEARSGAVWPKTPDVQGRFPRFCPPDSLGTTDHPHRLAWANINYSRDAQEIRSLPTIAFPGLIVAKNFNAEIAAMAMPGDIGIDNPISIPSTLAPGGSVIQTLPASGYMQISMNIAANYQGVGLQILAGNNPVMIVADSAMPYLDGISRIRALFSIRAEQKIMLYNWGTESAIIGWSLSRLVYAKGWG